MWIKEFLKTALGKGLLAILIVAVVIMGTYLILTIRIEIQPLQTAHVEVVSKRTKAAYYKSGGGGIAKLKYPYCFVTFKFSDGSEKEFNVNPRGVSKSKYELFNKLKEGDIGILSYKQVGDGAKLGQKFFISFEKDS